MAAGLPVIVTDQVGIHESISSAMAGLVTRCESDSVRAAIISLAQNPTLRVRIGANGRRLAHNLFSTEVVTEQLLSLYARISDRGWQNSPVTIPSTISAEDSFTASESRSRVLEELRA
jgi:glycosyltransferase involved in cell wall biosynthesis